MAFLGGVFYTPDMLPAFWRGVTIVNPLFYIVDALRWGFFDTAHISPVISMTILGVLAVGLWLLIRHIFLHTTLVRK